MTALREAALAPGAGPAGSGPPLRLVHVDLLKAVASQLIVLHHLAFYGPMSDAAARLAPAIFEMLDRQGRWAVQVFLVVGGYLAARSLAPGGRWHPELAPGPQVIDRYLRLVLPLAATLVLAIAAAAAVRGVMDHPSVPSPPQPGQVLAHLLMLQDLLGIEALSAGVWYVAIDFQLFALLVAVAWGSHRAARRFGREWPIAPWLMAAAVALSALFLNRRPEWDVAAPYFLASYGLGVLVAWSAGEPRRSMPLAAAAAAVALGLAIDGRPRLALAAAVAACLWLLERRTSAGRAAVRGVGAGVVERLGRISYSLFLVHFPVCLVVNALFVTLGPADDARFQLAGVVTAWAVSLAVAAGFHRLVEQPATRWVSRRRTARRRGSGLRR